MIVARHINSDGTVVEFEDFASYDAYVRGSTPQPTAEDLAKEQVGAYVDRLDAFCADFVKRMKVENILLGIGRADTKVVQQVTDITAAALNAVSLGSLRVALELIAAIPADQLDGQFLTDQRLTTKRNEIEDFLGIPKSKTYNE